MRMSTGRRHLGRLACAVSLAAAAPATVSAQHYFPGRPKGAPTSEVTGILTEYGIGNDSGSLTIRDDRGASHEFQLGGPPSIDGRSYDCDQPPRRGFKPTAEDCREWPAGVVLGATRVRVVYWRDREPITDWRGRRSGSTPVLATDELHVVKPPAPRGTACGLRTEDPRPPTAVRSKPDRTAAQVGALANHTRLAIDHGRAGWLRLAGPRPRWISINLTRFRCGDGGDGPERALAGVTGLGRAGAAGDQGAVDVLVAAMATPSLDGEAAEGAEDAMLKVMAANPEGAIRGLDLLAPKAAGTFLAGLSGQGALPRPFASAIVRPENRSTAAALALGASRQVRR